MRIINNNDASKNHFTVISECIQKYNSIYIAIAFLKESGLKNLIDEVRKALSAGKEIKIIAGQNFALTEPNALKILRKTFESHPSAKLYLSRFKAAINIFHPKIYLFKSNKDCCIISGSANLTQGGLTTNDEVSLLLKCRDSDMVWIDVKSYFDTLIQSGNADEASLLIIKQYETFYESQKQYNKQAKAVPPLTISRLDFNYKNLLKHFKKYDRYERGKQFKLKLDNYKKALYLLNNIADNSKLTQKTFESQLDQLVGSSEHNSLWHSGSLFRLRRQVYPFYKEFQNLVKYIKYNRNNSVATVFEGALKLVKPIKGAAANYVAEIMMTYDPDKFANINRNPINVLRLEGGVKLKVHSSSFNGDDYEEYCDLISEISEKLGLKSMLEADSFFNEIYWKINRDYIK